MILSKARYEYLMILKLVNLPSCISQVVTGPGDSNHLQLYQIHKSAFLLKKSIGYLGEIVSLPPKKR
jgi:hypothetical protein